MSAQYVSILIQQPTAAKERKQKMNTVTITADNAMSHAMQEQAVRTPASRLKAGDTLRFGNVLYGFWYSEVQSVTVTAPRRVSVLLTDGSVFNCGMTTNYVVKVAA